MPKDGHWKSYLVNFDPQYVLKNDLEFKVDEVVLCVESVNLLLNDNASFRKYIALSCMKIDSKVLEEGFYKSFLYLFEIDLSERKIKLACLDEFSGPITFLSDYQGHLLAA